MEGSVANLHSHQCSGCSVTEVCDRDHIGLLSTVIYTCSCCSGNAGDKSRETVNHPAHYGGADNPYEAIKVIRAWKLGFSLGNAVKYISRAGKKDATKTIEDLKKAAWYLNEEIAFLEGGKR
jgi:uncharacterized protein DUF3310